MYVLLFEIVGQLVSIPINDVVLKTSIDLKTIFLKSWSWTVLKDLKNCGLRLQFLDQKGLKI